LDHSVVFQSDIPEVVLIQLTVLMMSTCLLETCRKLELTNIRKQMCVKLVIYKDCNKMHGQQNKIKKKSISNNLYRFHTLLIQLLSSSHCTLHAGFGCGRRYRCMGLCNQQEMPFTQTACLWLFYIVLLL